MRFLTVGSARCDSTKERREASTATEREAQAKQNRNQAISGAVSALGGAALGAFEESALYKSKTMNQGNLSKMQWNPEQFSKFGKINGQDLDFEALGNMNQKQYKDFWKSLSYNQQQMLQSGQ
jgi:hypothetical protein